MLMATATATTMATTKKLMREMVAVENEESVASEDTEATVAGESAREALDEGLVFWVDEGGAGEGEVVDAAGVVVGGLVAGCVGVVDDGMGSLDSSTPGVAAGPAK